LKVESLKSGSAEIAVPGLLPRQIGRAHWPSALAPASTISLIGERPGVDAGSHVADRPSYMALPLVAKRPADKKKRGAFFRQRWPSAFEYT